MAKPKPAPSSEVLEFIRQNFRYNPDTGEVLRVCGYVNKQGYRRLELSLGSGEDRVSTSMPAHRVAWFLMTGEWPDSELQVDHINRDRADNRWDNLRLCTPSQNATNRKAWGEVKSKGVQMHRRGNYVRFKATIGTWPDVKLLGLFRTEEEAAAAYVKAALEKYGEFAPVDKE